MFYNLTADVKHKAGLRRRLYFSTNGTARFETTTGMVKTTHGNVTCTTHQAFLRVREERGRDGERDGPKEQKVGKNRLKEGRKEGGMKDGGRDEWTY